MSPSSQVTISSETASTDRGIKSVTKAELIRKRLYRDRYLYLLLLPVIALFVLFRLIPLNGEIIAFKNFRLTEGIWGSAWVGFDQFERLFQSKDFYNVLKNTFLLNVYNLIFGFPVPIILALLLNELRKEWYKRIVQNLFYLPHFISWVVLGSIIIGLLSPSTGLVNTILKSFGMEPIFFMADKFWWPVTYVSSGIWREAGYGTILYIAAMAAIDPQQYEAAKLDGANKWRQIWHVTLPGIRSTIAIILILQMGKFLDVGFEQVFVLQNPAVYSVSEVVNTYIYRIGLQNLQYSYSTAIGLFQSAVGLILILSVNRIIRSMGEKGLW